MAGPEPPSLPRLSPIGWSVDDASEVHAAVFDIADGSVPDSRARPPAPAASSKVSPLFFPLDEEEQARQKQQSSHLPHFFHSPPHQRAPLRERLDAAHANNNHNATTSASHSPVEHHRSNGIFRPRKISNRQSSLASLAVDSTAASPDLVQAPPPPLHSSSSSESYRGSISHEIDSVAASPLPLQTASEDRKQDLNRSSSLYKLKRTFRRRKKSLNAELPTASTSSRDDDTHRSNGDTATLRRPTTAPDSRKSTASSRGESFASFSSKGRASSELDGGTSSSSRVQPRSRGSVAAGGVSSNRIEERSEPNSYDNNTVVIVSHDHLSVRPASRGLDRPDEWSTPTVTLNGPGHTNGRKKASLDAPHSAQSLSSPILPNPSSSSSSRSSTRSVRRRARDHLPPSSKAPRVPLPLPPVPYSAEQRGDPSDEREVTRLVPGAQPSSFSTGSDADTERSVRKTKSQSSLRLLRKASFLSGLRQSSESSQKDELFPIQALRKASNASSLSGPSPNDAASPVAMSVQIAPSDFSPGSERKSLPTSSAEDLRDGSSTPSLEEARRALSPMTMDLVPPNGLDNNTSRPPSSSDSRSRLEVSGGASSLFGASTGSGGGRRRASSLLPWRTRTTSQANLAVDGLSISPSPLTPDSRSSAESTTAISPKPKTPKTDANAFVGDPSAFIEHVVATVPRAEVPAVLAGAGDALHKDALHIFMRRFLFAGHPLDVALRKLLMSLCLPKETQQIDRVMEAFAQRYNECNDQLFLSNDQPYMLAFSLMMLHTDTFNRNAKQKMTKADYVRNTAASGVAPEILEYLYDNLTFTQFIYVEDDDFLKRRKAEFEMTSALRSAFSSSGGNGSNGKGRVDPYRIIASGQTHTLRPEINIDEDSPFSFTGTAPSFDFEKILKAFVNAPSIEVITARKSAAPSASTAVIGGFYSTLPTSVGKEEETIVTLRVTKVGCISRKDDLMEDNKKAQSRKWKTCGMILSSSQLLFFRDLVWTSALDQRIIEQTREQPEMDGCVTITPRITYFKPDGVLALGDAVAVRDSTYTKYKHVFRLIARQGDLNRQYLIQTANDEEMNDWIHKINLCSTFRSAGLRIRGLNVDSPSPVDGDFGPQAVLNGQDASQSPPTSPSAASIASSATTISTTTATTMSPNGALREKLLRRKLTARLREFTPIIEAVSALLTKHQDALDEKLRLARHLTIATPFTKTTRDRLESLAVPLAQEVRQLRLEVARCACRKEMLILELEAGNRAVKASALSSTPEMSEAGVGGEGEGRRAKARESFSFTPYPNGLSPLALTPGDRSLSTSRASSISQSRTDSFSLGESSIPVPKLPSASSSSSNSGGLHKRIISDTDTDTPTMRSIALPGDDAHGHPLPATTSPPRDDKSSNGNGVPHSSPRHTSRFHHLVGSPSTRHSSSSRDETVERWDRTKMGRDADKRVSLVHLPDPQQWQTLTPKLAMNASLRAVETEKSTAPTSPAFQSQSPRVL